MKQTVCPHSRCPSANVMLIYGIGESGHRFALPNQLSRSFIARNLWPSRGMGSIDQYGSSEDEESLEKAQEETVEAEVENRCGLSNDAFRLSAGFGAVAGDSLFHAEEEEVYSSEEEFSGFGPLPNHQDMFYVDVDDIYSEEEDADTSSDDNDLETEGLDGGRFELAKGNVIVQADSGTAVKANAAMAQAVAAQGQAHAVTYKRPQAGKALRNNQETYATARELAKTMELKDELGRELKMLARSGALAKGPYFSRAIDTTGKVQEAQARNSMRKGSEKNPLRSIQANIEGISVYFILPHPF